MTAVIQPAARLWAAAVRLSMFAATVAVVLTLTYDGVIGPFSGYSLAVPIIAMVLLYYLGGILKELGEKSTVHRWLCALPLLAIGGATIFAQGGMVWILCVVCCLAIRFPMEPDTEGTIYY